MIKNSPLPIYIYRLPCGNSQVLILCFAKFSRNTRKLSRSTKLIISQNFRENTKTKIFAALLIYIHSLGMQENVYFEYQQKWTDTANDDEEVGVHDDFKLTIIHN